LLRVLLKIKESQVCIPTYAPSKNLLVLPRYEGKPKALPGVVKTMFEN
jgi:hypothetical protein